jgi:hypothetical protein
MVAYLPTRTVAGLAFKPIAILVVEQGICQLPPADRWVASGAGQSLRFGVEKVDRRKCSAVGAS